MSRSRPFGITSVISTAGTLCLTLFQLVLSDLPCEENEMKVADDDPNTWLPATHRCVNYNEQQPNSWYVWFLLLIFLVALLCGVVLYCFQCWLKRPRIDSSRRTMAVFAVGDLDPIYGTEASVNPTVGIHLHTQSPELYHVPCFGALGPPPPYEETLKTSQF